MSGRLTQTPVLLKTGNTPAWQLWAQLAQFARHLRPTDWVLVGGQMVALHCHVADITPGRDHRHRHRCQCAGQPERPLHVPRRRMRPRPHGATIGEQPPPAPLPQ